MGRQPLTSYFLRKFLRDFANLEVPFNACTFVSQYNMHVTPPCIVDVSIQHLYFIFFVRFIGILFRPHPTRYKKKCIKKSNKRNWQQKNNSKRSGQGGEKKISSMVIRFASLLVLPSCYSNHPCAWGRDGGKKRAIVSDCGSQLIYAILFLINLIYVFFRS